MRGRVMRLLQMRSRDAVYLLRESVSQLVCNLGEEIYFNEDFSANFIKEPNDQDYQSSLLQHLGVPSNYDRCLLSSWLVYNIQMS